MKIRRLCFGLTLVCVVGCSRKPEVVPFSGLVKTSSGQPVTGVRIVLQPTTGTHIARTFGYDLDKQGRFRGAAFPGTYAFFLSTVSVERDDDNSEPVNDEEAKKLKDSAELLSKYPPSYRYRSPKHSPEDHTVELTAGANLELIINDKI